MENQLAPNTGTQEMIPCPLHGDFVIKRKLIRHLSVCRRNYMGEWQFCEYNRRHGPFPIPELKFHLETCPQRGLLDSIEEEPLAFGMDYPLINLNDDDVDLLSSNKYFKTSARERSFSELLGLNMVDDALAAIGNNMDADGAIPQVKLDVQVTNGTTQAKGQDNPPVGFTIGIEKEFGENHQDEHSLDDFSDITLDDILPGGDLPKPVDAPKDTLNAEDLLEEDLEAMLERELPDALLTMTAGDVLAMAVGAVFN